MTATASLEQALLQRQSRLSGSFERIDAAGYHLQHIFPIPLIASLVYYKLIMQSYKRNTMKLKLHKQSLQYLKLEVPKNLEKQLRIPLYHISKVDSLQ
jgi:hypothetical protein